MVMDAALPGPRLDLGFYVFTLLAFLALLSVLVTAAVAAVALEPIRRRAWHLASIQTDAGYAAFRYRRHPRRAGYQLVDLWTTNRGAGLGFGHAAIQDQPVTSRIAPPQSNVHRMLQTPIT